MGDKTELKDLGELQKELKEEKKRLKEERIKERRAELKRYPSPFARAKYHRIRWKQEKLRRRMELYERYKDAPWYIRIPRLYLIKPCIALLIIAVLGSLAYSVVPQMGFQFLQDNKNNPVDRKEILALSPIDEEGAKRIDALPAVDKNDTWTISVYINGSSLEDMGENDLSSLVQAQIQEARQQRELESAEKTANRLKSFTSELGDNKLDMPSYLYYPRHPVRSDDEEEESGEKIADGPGAATMDIDEMTSDTWSDNIRIVIQTGGATRWSNSMVNPNRTQRFVYEKGEFKEVYNSPLQKAADPATLTSFLNFCKEEYPADHNMLILWNHGGASFGYGHDSIYGNMMTLKEIRAGLEGAYKPDMNNPAFDIIGYDACLMSSVEVTHAMSGFASYYAVSEEVEPGEGWDYGPWLKAMSEDPTMNPAKVAQHIADSYTDFYMTHNVNMGWAYSEAVTFSVLDAKKAEELYNAYCELTKKQLSDATKDISVLAEVGRCSDKSLHYPAADYNTYNTIDLGIYVDNMVDRYPEEASRIKQLIGETVLYHRENGSLTGSQGITVYVPGSVEDYDGLMMCLKYIYDVCEDPSTQALYYYKIAGCLNEDMQKYLATITDQKMPVIDLKPFEAFSSVKPSVTDTGFEIPVDEKLQSMLQSYSVETGFYDKEAGVVKNYGRDELARLDGEGKMDCEFDGTWICFDGVPLATEVVTANESKVEYRSKVVYNGKEAYLSFSYDRDKEEFTVDGIRGASINELSGGILNTLFNQDPVNYLVNSRMNTEIEEGDTIKPVYELNYTSSEAAEDADQKKEEEGEEITVGKNSRIKEEKLESGSYLTAAVISDSRGDVYYSQVIENEVSGGKVNKRKAARGFVGRDY